MRIIIEFDEKEAGTQVLRALTAALARGNGARGAQRDAGEALLAGIAGGVAARPLARDGGRVSLSKQRVNRKSRVQPAKKPSD